jgi:hypothetical protein
MVAPGAQRRAETVRSEGVRRTGSRIDAVDLIRRVPGVPEVAEGVARHAVGVACFLACLLVSYVASRFVGLWPTVLILLVSAWVSASCIHWVDGARAAAVIRRSLMCFRPRLPLAHEKSRGRTATADGVVPGALVYPFEDYRQLLANNGGSAVPPKVPYRLVLASFKAGEDEQRVAYSDGTAVTWHRTTMVLLNSVRESWWRPEREEEQGAAAAFRELIAFLCHAQERKSVRAIREQLGGHREPDVDRALDAARRWRLMSGGRSACMVTSAGRIWHVASETGGTAGPARRSD